MPRHTFLPTSLWSWKPFSTLPTSDAKVMLLALYTSAPAKRLPPGLWYGSIHSIVEESTISLQAARDAIFVLVERGIVEIDEENRVARLTELPSADERCSTPNHLKGWWNSFRTLPDCDLRNTHISVLRWLMEAEPDPVKLVKLEDVWRVTFGSLRVPPSRGEFRRLADASDTSTPIQTSLFAPKPPAQRGGLEPKAVDNLLSGAGSDSVILDPKNIKNAICVTSEDGIRMGSDTHSDPSGIGTGTGIISSSLGGGSGEDVAKPKLTLVPPDMPFSVDELVAAVGGLRAADHAFLTEDRREALKRTISGLREFGYGAEVLTLLRESVQRQSIPELLQPWPQRYVFLVRHLSRGLDEHRSRVHAREQQRLELAELAKNNGIT